MKKEQIFELLEKAIKHISEDFNCEEVESMIGDTLIEAQVPFEWSIDYGISKAVILIKGESFVIKMPFFKLYDDAVLCEERECWSCNKSSALHSFHEKRKKEEKNENYSLSLTEIKHFYSEWERNHPEPTEDDYSCLYDIEGASNIDLGEGVDPAIPDWDYCCLESVIYQLALEEGLGAYFAEEGYLGTIDFTPVYYQTRCIPMNTMSIDYNSREYQKKKSKSETICKELDIDCFNSVWIADFIELYGKEELKRLNSFLDRYEIGDLRTCNIGYLDGAPILFDYSGYRDW